MWTSFNTRLDTWFERDRTMVSLTDAAAGRVLIEAWDEDVHALVEDGFLDPSDWHGSAVEYANHLGGAAILSPDARHERLASRPPVMETS